MNRNKIYSRITDTILQKLKEGTAVWKKTWSVGLPTNLISKKEYQGINFLSLLTKDFPSKFFLTFKQCEDRGGRINKGAKGFPIIFWKLKEIEVETGKKREIKEVPIARLSYVFNLSQTSLYEDKSEELKLPSCESIIESMKDKPVIKHNSSRCYYSIKGGYISLPKISDFDSPDTFYETLFHELIHATGHKSRLNRFESDQALEEYSKEELIAELGASYLCSLTGISNNVIENQAAYIDGWYKKLSSQPEILIEAAKEAQKAVDYLLGELCR